ncbi:12853_t:CDS:1, partial [Entrophospora sp. SA101]
PSHVVNNLDELLKKISGNLDDLIRKSMKYIYRNRNDANDYIDYKDFASSFPESTTPISDNNNIDINNDINEPELYNENPVLEASLSFNKSPDDISTVSRDDLTINHNDDQNELEPEENTEPDMNNGNDRLTHEESIDASSIRNKDNANVNNNISVSKEERL